MELDDYLRLTEEIQEAMAKIQSILAYNMTHEEKLALCGQILIARSKFAELEALRLDR